MKNCEIVIDIQKTLGIVLTRLADITIQVNKTVSSDGADLDCAFEMLNDNIDAIDDTNERITMSNNMIEEKIETRVNAIMDNIEGLNAKFDTKHNRADAALYHSNKELKREIHDLKAKNTHNEILIQGLITKLNELTK